MIPLLREPVYNAISDLPDGLYALSRRVLRSRQKDDLVLYCDLRRFYNKSRRTEIPCFEKTMVVTRGYWEYEYFNVCFLNNMLMLCLKAVTEGCIPRIEVKTSKGENLWEEFFRQPYYEVSTEKMSRIIADENTPVRMPPWDVVYDEKKINWYGSLYSAFTVLNCQTEEYILKEIEQVTGMGKVLGVLCRGTDYTRTKPATHPVQPSGEAVIEKAGEIFEAGKYDYIYLATEDSRYDMLFRERFADRILTNKRCYYDKAFEDQKISLIKDVHFDRENDEYLKGLEYLSSLKILSECEGLVAGNCGGTLAAVMWNNNRYSDKYIFDMGIY